MLLLLLKVMLVRKVLMLLLLLRLKLLLLLLLLGGARVSQHGVQVIHGRERLRGSLLRTVVQADRGITLGQVGLVLVPEGGGG